MLRSSIALKTRGAYDKTLHRFKRPNLLESQRTRAFHLEFTSRCNLKCIYCAAGQPDYQGSDIAPETIDKVIELLVRRKPEVVSVNGHGETTIYKDWHLYCNRMLDLGLNLHIISNFCKKFSPEELETLSRFKSIEISCDTHDPILFAKLRRGADMVTLGTNLQRLKTCCKESERPFPSINFSCVISDQNALHLEEYVKFGLSLGVCYFNFCTLNPYPELEDAGSQEPRPMTVLPLEKLHRAEKVMLRAFDILKRSRILYRTQGDPIGTLRETIRRLETAPAQGGVQTPSAELPYSHQETLPPETPDREVPAAMEAEAASWSRRSLEFPPDGTRTRDCLEPWEFLMVRSNRDVYPCCWYPPVFSMSESPFVRDMFNSSPIKAIRRGLLTGQLSRDCRTCVARGWTTTGELRKKVQQYLSPFPLSRFFYLKGKMVPDQLSSIEVEHGEGWYPPESDETLNPPERRHWQWVGRQAFCRLENPGKETVLSILGGVNKAILQQQGVTVKCNGEPLDTFVPEEPYFFKEYILPTGLMGRGSYVPLVLETDRTFVPAREIPGAGDTRELGVQVFQLFAGVKKKEGRKPATGGFY